MLDSNKQQAFTKTFLNKSTIFDVVQKSFQASLIARKRNTVEDSRFHVQRNLRQRHKKRYSFNCYCWESLNSDGPYLTLIHLFIHAKRVQFRGICLRQRAQEANRTIRRTLSESIQFITICIQKQQAVKGTHLDRKSNKGLEAMTQLENLNLLKALYKYQTTVHCRQVKESPLNLMTVLVNGYRVVYLVSTN